MRKTGPKAIQIAATLLLATAGTIVAAASSGAAGVELAPQTKLRLSIVQWIPSKGQYEQWTALGGDFVISRERTISLPVIGSLSVQRMDGEALANAVSQRLQKRLGLVSTPDTTVQILEYPPIYTVGDVQTPGEYRFRSGMTALQALAMSGGRRRDVDDERPDEQIKILGDLRGVETDILRTRVRIARLQAERAGAREFTFPAAQAAVADRKMLAAFYAQEKVVFATRANAISRQAKSLKDLRDLFNAEIEVLKKKIENTDTNIAALDKQLSGVKGLVEKGIAVASRQSDLERALSGFRGDRLDLATEIMRARQKISEATRNVDALEDDRQTEIASSLQKEQANLDQFQLKREVSQRLLFEKLTANPDAAGAQQQVSLAFSIIRATPDGARTLSASEATALQPGDVVKVSIEVPAAVTGDFSESSHGNDQAAGKSVFLSD